MMQSDRVKTSSDLMSIALQAEREAIRRYTQLSVCMHKGNNESAAALFERMVSEEQEHERLLLEWMTQEGIDVSPAIKPVRWQDPHVSNIYNEEARDPLYSSPYKALAFAVHNEEIAFRFYTHVAANSENSAVRKYAEILAHEELGHAALLRAERRRAYHAERNASFNEPRLNPKAIHNETDLLAAAIHIDRYLAEEINLIHTSSAEIDQLARETQQQIIDNEHELDKTIHKYKNQPGVDICSILEQLKLHNNHVKNLSNTPESALQRLWACCDRSFSFYDSVVENADDEIVMLTAQKLSSSALDRIGVLKRAFGESNISDS